jgi:hypothetical protein
MLMLYRLLPWLIALLFFGYLVMLPMLVTHCNAVIDHQIKSGQMRLSC